MNKIFLLTVWIFIVSLFTANSYGQFLPKVYKSPEMKTESFSNNTVAILPVFAEYQDLKLMRGRNFIFENSPTLYESISQKEIYARLLKRKSKNKFVQAIQDVNKTNRILKENGIISNEEMLNHSYQDIATMLNVEAVIVCNIFNASTFNEFGAAGLSILFGQNIPTGYSGIAFSMHDGKTDDLIYKYARYIGSYYSRSLERNTSFLVKRASKRMKFKI